MNSMHAARMDYYGEDDNLNAKELFLRGTLTLINAKNAAQKVSI